MEKSQKIILISIIILIILLIIVVGIYKKINKENRVSEKYDLIDEIALKNNIELVDARNNFYIVKECTNKFYTYYMTIFNIEESYYNVDEKMLQKAKEQNAEAIYNMLDSEYIAIKEINKDNILTKLDKINTATVNITNMYVSEQTNNISVYIVKGMLKENNSEKVSQFQIIVKVDSFNETFSIIPQDYVEEKYKNLQVGDNIKIEVPENIEENTNNKYIFKFISDETYVKDLFNQYKSEALNTISLAYKRLNEEYKNKKFETLEKFEKYIDNNKTKYLATQITQYQKKVTDDYTQYVCIDQNGNYYIFRENAVMDYELILDTYTVDLPEFIEKYNNADEKERILLNIQKIFEAINSGDYKYVYSKLDSTFKSNYFKTQEQFEKYIKENWYSYNKVSYGSYQKSGEIYVYNIQITDGDNGKTEKIDKKVVMKLLEGTDFVMSFNVE